MAKPGNKNNKARCDKYKQQSRRAKNKALKQERHEKRMARFAKRKAEGKDYANRKNATVTDPENRGTNMMEKQLFRDFENDNRLPYARSTSVFRKLSNMVANEELRIKKALERTSNGKKKGKEN